MARFSFSRAESGKSFDSYDQLFPDLPVDVRFEGITKEGNFLSFKKGKTRIDVSFESQKGTYKIVDISKRTGLARVFVFAKKIDKVFTREELIDWFKNDSKKIEVETK
jgi:hypothetical protein